MTGYSEVLTAVDGRSSSLPIEWRGMASLVKFSQCPEHSMHRIGKRLMACMCLEFTKFLGLSIDIDHITWVHTEKQNYILHSQHYNKDSEGYIQTPKDSGLTACDSESSSELHKNFLTTYLSSIFLQSRMSWVRGCSCLPSDTWELAKASHSWVETKVLVTLTCDQWLATDITYAMDSYLLMLHAHAHHLTWLP